MAISITSFTPNTKIESSSANTNNSNLKTGVEKASYRGFSWGLEGTIITGNEKGMQFIVPQGLTVQKLWAKTGSGTATIRIQKDDTDITHSSNHMDVTSTVSSTTTFNATSITSGQVLTLDVISVSSAEGLFVTLETQVTDNI